MTTDLNSEGFEQTNYLTKRYPKTPDIYVIREHTGIRLSSPEAVNYLLKNAMKKLDHDKEHFFCASLNTKNSLKSLDIISIGCLNANIVHPREVFYAAIANRAAAIIVAHNHPSGDPAPSQDDINITVKIKEGGELLGIDVCDHIIFGADESDGFLSMKEQRLAGW